MIIRNAHKSGKQLENVFEAVDSLDNNFGWCRVDPLMNGDLMPERPLEIKISAGGEDEESYEVKIRATELLLDNVGNTFVTPVFNGSASLRDAAGQLIENTAKSVRRKETVDDAYFEALFEDVNSLYRLDQHTGASAAGREDLGPLPAASAALLGTIAAVWIGMGAYLLAGRIRKKKEGKS